MRARMRVARGSQRCSFKVIKVSSGRYPFGGL